MDLLQGFFFSLCIRDRTWLRLIGITIFILASLHSFGLLEKSINLLGHLAFNLGERKISVLDFINGLGVLFILLWLSSFLGSTAEKKIRKLPNLPPFPSSSTGENPTITTCLYILCHRIKHHRTRSYIFCSLGGSRRCWYRIRFAKSRL